MNTIARELPTAPGFSAGASAAPPCPASWNRAKLNPGRRHQHVPPPPAEPQQPHADQDDTHGPEHNAGLQGCKQAPDPEGPAAPSVSRSRTGVRCQAPPEYSPSAFSSRMDAAT